MPCFYSEGQLRFCKFGRFMNLLLFFFATTRDISLAGAAILHLLDVESALLKIQEGTESFNDTGWILGRVCICIWSNYVWSWRQVFVTSRHGSGEQKTRDWVYKKAHGYKDTYSKLETVRGFLFWMLATFWITREWACFQWTLKRGCCFTCTVPCGLVSYTSSNS